jgi:NitT/TauT family transport system permease protein
MPAGGRRSRRWLWLPVLLAWLLIWQLSWLLIGSDLLLSSPLQVAGRLSVLLLQPEFWLTMLLTILRIQAGFALGVLVGTVLGILTVHQAWAHAFFHPAISAIRSTPVASFIILALVWMSAGRVVIFIVFLMVLPIVWANIAEGIRRTDPQLLEMARVFRLSRGQIVRLIYLPTLSPFFIAAATTSLGLGWKAGIAAEVLSLPKLALGSRLYEAKIYLETADLLAFTGVIILLSLLLERALLFLLRRTEAYFQKHGRMGAISNLSRQDLRLRRNGRERGE